MKNTNKTKLSISAVILLTNVPVANAAILPNVNANSNESLSIGSGDSVVYTPSYGNAVSANGSNSLVTATDTSVTTLGDNNNAINAFNGGVVNITSSSIKTNGNSAFGITAQVGGTVNANNVIIDSSGNNSSGVRGGGGTLNLNNIEINTSGNTSYGIISDTASSIVHLTGGTIKTTGDRSHGVTATNGILDLNNTTIETFGDLARGINVSGNASVSSENINIITHGNDRSDGIVSSGIFTGNNITINAEGSNSYAITMAELGKLHISNTQISSKYSAINFTAQASKLGAIAEFENANITTEDKVVVAGNSTGNISFIKTIANSTTNQFASAGNNAILNIEAKDNTIISGSLVADATSTISLSLENDSSWSGYSQNADMISLDNSSNWILTDNSDTKNLVSNGAIIFGNSTPINSSIDFYTLSANNLAGSGSFEMRVEGVSGDFLNITDNVSGNHTVLVKGSGEEGSDGYHLIHAQGSQNDSFGLKDGLVDLGTYQYSLTQNGNDWFLTQEATTTPAVDAVISIASAPQFIFDGEMQNLRFRKGDLRNNKGNTGGVWGRYLTNNTRSKAGHGAAYRLQQDGFEIGGDNVFTLSSGQLVIGGLTSFTDNTLKHARGGKTDISSYSLGLYATYFSDVGYYIDSLVKVNRFDNKLNALVTDGSSTHSEYNQNAIGSALEVGYQYQLDNNYFIEPYIRATYFIAESKNIQLDNGMNAKLYNSKSAKGEIGTSFGKLFDLNNGSNITTYARVALEREFIKNNNIIINNVNEFNNNFSGNIGKYGIGVNSQVNKLTSIYAEIDYRKGQKIESPIMGNVGFRINF
jgi:outer membrane autotransporter protein